MKKYYSFHTRDGKWLGYGWFANDADAAAYARREFPAEYRRGLEMRKIDA